MNLKVYTDQQLFWDEVSPHLYSEPVMNSLMLGLSKNFIDSPNGCIYQSAVFDEQGFQGALVCSQFLNLRNLVVSGPKNQVGAQRLIEDYLTCAIPITGIVGKKELVELYAPILKDSGVKLKVTTAQGVYACQSVVLPESEGQYIFRPANEEDLETVGRWVEEFKAEALPNEKITNGEEYVAPKIKAKQIYVLEVDTQLVSMASLSREVGNMISIGFVYTPEEFRKIGYASLVTALLTGLQLKDGKQTVSLYTDLANPTSNKIYQKIGYKFFGESLHLGVVEAPSESL